VMIVRPAISIVTLWLSTILYLWKSNGCLYNNESKCGHMMVICPFSFSCCVHSRYTWCHQLSTISDSSKYWFWKRLSAQSATIIRDLLFLRSN
jgi:hypothetical protein